MPNPPRKRQHYDRIKNVLSVKDVGRYATSSVQFAMAASVMVSNTNGLPRRPYPSNDVHAVRQLLPGVALPSEIAAMVTVFAMPSPRMVHRLLAHFTDCSLRWLSIRTGCHRTTFLHHLLPAAMENPWVLNCILTVAAADLTKCDSANLELQCVAVEYYGQAIADLRKALREEDILMGSAPHALLSGKVPHDC